MEPGGVIDGATTKDGLDSIRCQGCWSDLEFGRGFCWWKAMCVRVGSSRGKVEGVGWEQGVLGRWALERWGGG